jgi:hypothetical protein
MSEGWIQTYTGRKFDVLEPLIADVVPEDIAWALAHICRFQGHVHDFYSVAQHSAYVSMFCDEQDALWGLMHDASEAYVADVSRPLKRLPEFAAYREIEARLMQVVCARFDLPTTQPSSVSRADLEVLSAESEWLMSPLHAEWTIRPPEFPAAPIWRTVMRPGTAYGFWWQRFLELGGQRFLR